MGIFIEIFLIGVGLAMDAFAVSICKGLGMKTLNKKQAIVIAAYFGGFQALMPLIGWILGIRFQEYIVAVDHWIAFILLVIIGGKMIFEALKNEGCEVVEIKNGPLNHKELVVFAVATSIDALAIGITFALLDTPIVPAIIIIGITTFVICVLGVVVGNVFGCKYKSKAELAGGLILVLMGTKILLEHLEILVF